MDAFLPAALLEGVDMSRAPKPSYKPAVPAPAAPARTSDVRNSPLPRSAAPTGTTKKEITAEAIARRAYEIWQSGKGGSDFDNWVRAERELRASQGSQSGQQR
jgi:hypothetical protein